MEAPQVSYPAPTAWHLHRVFMNSISDDSAYVFQILPLVQTSLFAVSSSDNVIKLYDANLSPVGQLAGHTSTIHESELDRNFLYSVSADSSIRCWDVRTKVQVGQLGGNRGVPVAEGFCLGHAQHLLAAGMGSSVHLWDIRALGTGRPMRTYSDIHTDDVTQAKFGTNGALVSASMDGTVCFWDTTTDDEDSQILHVIPIDESVSTIGFVGAQREHLYCLTHTERLSIWNAATVDRLRDFSDIREKVSTVTQLDYLVGCHWEAAAQQLLIVGGSFAGLSKQLVRTKASDATPSLCDFLFITTISSNPFLRRCAHRGEVVVMQVTDSGVAPCFRFSGGHQAVVRSFHWDSTSNLVITGAEDSRLCVWGPVAPAVPPVVPSPSRDGPVRKEGKAKKVSYKPY